MNCIRPLIATYDSKGNVTFDRNTPSSPGLIGFQVDCHKCIPCRLKTAREKAIRALHEADQHNGNNIFLTLTYAPEKLTSDKLQYRDFQLFMKSLRELRTRNVENPKENKIKFMVTGEYGDKTKRPHWHTILFNYWPHDALLHRENELGHKIYTSKEIETIWDHGFSEFGGVTMESAGYVARYAAKKLIHGKDQDHDYHPKHQPSQGIGKQWIEKYWKQTFTNGYVVLPNGEKCSIPRYYQEWLKKHQPDAHHKYLSTKKLEIIEQMEQKTRREEIEYLNTLYNGTHDYRNAPLTKATIKHQVLTRKFNRLQKELKI